MSQSTPLISIGIPTYNRPVTLRRTILSVVNQTYSNLEIIVSDNGSTNPDVQNVIDEFSGDTRIRFVRQPKNLGLVGNFNYLAKEATGEYFMWLADDDWLSDDYIEVCSSFLRKNPDYVAAYGAGKVYDENTRVMTDDVPICLEQTTPKERMQHFLNEVMSNGCLSALFPLRLRESLLMKDVIAGDWLIVLRFAFYGKYKMLDNTNVIISSSGVSATIEGLTRHMSTFTRSFPYLTVCLNLLNDIVLDAKVYKKLGFVDRWKLSIDCMKLVYRRFNVRRELRPGTKKFLRFKREKIVSRFGSSSN